jgi:hypothetical protein
MAVFNSYVSYGGYPVLPRLNLQGLALHSPNGVLGLHPGSKKKSENVGDNNNDYQLLGIK